MIAVATKVSPIELIPVKKSTPTSELIKDEPVRINCLFTSKGVTITSCGRNCLFPKLKFPGQLFALVHPIF